MRRVLPPIVRGLASLLAPTACPICDARVGRAPRTCRPCARALLRLRAEARPRRSPRVEPIAPFPMRGQARRLVHRMKYEGNAGAARILALWMARALRETDPHGRGALLVPVPLHPARRRERGFNQAERLARQVGRRLGRPVRTDLLRRIRWEGSQTVRVRSGRRAAVDGAFTLTGPPPPVGLVLVDDVWTTGATARECRRILLLAGALPPVRILVAARTLRRRPLKADS